MLVELDGLEIGGWWRVRGLEVFAGEDTDDRIGARVVEDPQVESVHLQQAADDFGDEDEVGIAQREGGQLGVEEIGTSRADDIE